MLLFTLIIILIIVLRASNDAGLVVDGTSLVVVLVTMVHMMHGIGHDFCRVSASNAIPQRHPSLKSC